MSVTAKVDSGTGVRAEDRAKAQRLISRRASDTEHEQYVKLR